MHSCSDTSPQPEKNSKEKLTRVSISQEGADGEKDLGDCQCWRPVILQDVQADLSLVVDVAVVDSSAEHNLMGLS